jgi:acid phosphatase
MVVIVVEENHSFEQVIGSPAMPYLNSLTQQGALATQYYAMMHPSIPNYFALTSGGTWTTDDNFPGPLSADNLVRQINAAGKKWKSYAEDLPSPGYLGTTMGSYIQHHNPFVYFSDVVSDPRQAANVVPFTQFAADLNAGALPDFSFVVPNALDDAHNCPAGVTCSDNDLLSRADQWLQANIGPLLPAPQFQKRGLLLIVFDESTLSDMRNGGGRVPLIAIGPWAKAGAQSAATYNHMNTLRSICEVLALPSCPGAAASMSGEEDLIQH